MNVEDVARDITYHPVKRIDLFTELAVPHQAAVFERLSPHVRKSILDHLKDSELVDLLDQMDMQAAA